MSEWAGLCFRYKVHCLLYATEENLRTFSSFIVIQSFMFVCEREGLLLLHVCLSSFVLSPFFCFASFFVLFLPSHIFLRGTFIVVCFLSSFVLCALFCLPCVFLRFVSSFLFVYENCYCCMAFCFRLSSLSSLVFLVSSFGLFLHLYIYFTFTYLFFFSFCLRCAEKVICLLRSVMISCSTNGLKEFTSFPSFSLLLRYCFFVLFSSQQTLLL